MHPLTLRVFSSLTCALVIAGCATAPAESDSSSSSASSSTETTASSQTVATRDERRDDAQRTTTDRPAGRSASSTSRESTSENSSDASSSNARLVAQLNEASRELASLRAANARLRAEGGKSSDTRVSSRNDPVDEKLAASLRSYSQFKQDLAAFMAEMEKSRSESATFNSQLKEASNRAEEAKAASARLETELRKERNARIDAEQAASKLREQLRAIGRAMASAGVTVDKSALEEPTARLQVNTSRLRESSGDGPRKHIVKPGETLQQLAEKYYGDASKWRTILDANRGFVRLDGKLEAGMELEVPAK
jgi:nucleoid-associated protein YgaU